MTAATGFVRGLWSGSDTEWRLVLARRPNVLIEAPVSATERFLRQLQAHLCVPLARKPPHTPLRLELHAPQALVVEGVESLNCDEQAHLLTWICGPGSRTQIVSTTEQPLFSSVACGLFNSALYYRLNVVVIRIGRDPSDN